MKTKNINFKSSVNIKFDINKEEYFKRYLPTPSHADSLLGILKGFNHTEENHSHIIIGPYGTGKSLLGTILSGIVSKNVNKNTFNLLLEKFNNVDDDIYKELGIVRNSNKRYLPVILNGYEGKFRQAIISSIMTVINNSGIDITIPGVVTKIIETLDIWKKEYPKTFKQFKVLLSERNYDITSWRMEVLTQEKKEIQWFSDVFPTLTSGAQFLVDFHEDFMGQIKYVLDELSKEGIGLFIVYDEFGRFLQNLEVHEIHETMQDLQDLAELSDHYSDDMHLLIITHKNLRQYFLKFNDEYKNEFQRIEKRFKLYHIESDKATFIRLTASTLNNLNIKQNKTDIEVKNFLRKYPLFPELNQVEIENIVIKGVQPIHPVTLYLLPFLSSLHGQNERTLFTFLESYDKGGLLKHINNSNDYYLPHQLFDYFFPSLDIEDIEQDSPSMVLYKKITNKIPEINNIEKLDELNILKFITLWNITGLQSKFKTTSEFLSFAMEKKELVIKQILSSLESYKAIRYNRVLGYWEVFEGSSFNIDELIIEQLDSTNISRKRKLSILEDSLTRKFYLSNDYNDKKSITRFASVNLVYSSDILNNVFDSAEDRRKKEADAIINYVILESSNDYERVVKALQLYRDEHSIFCISTYTFDFIEKQVIDYYLVEKLLDDEELLKKDKDLKSELLLRKEDLLFVINDFMSVYQKFDSNLFWILKNDRAHINNEIVLGIRLSELMFELYPDTPEIRNDSYNRRKINNVQQKAGYKVVDNIINNFSEYNINIDGNGPDYLIFATTFKNNKFNFKDLNKIENSSFNKIRNRLLSIINENPNGKLSLLTDVLFEKPFGIRKPLIPILLIALLRDKWDELLFYRNGMFIDNVNGEILFSMVEDSSNYQFIYFQLDNRYNKLIENITTIFKEFYNDLNNTHKILAANEAMLKWLRTLPRYTQTTNKLNERLLSFKMCIKHGEVDPTKAFEMIYNEFNDSIDLVDICVQELNSFISIEKKNLERNLLMLVGCDNYQQLKEWASEKTIPVQKENKLISSILTIQNERNWIEDLIINFIGIEIQNWTDTTREMFDHQISSEYNRLTEDFESDKEYKILTVGDTNRAIERVELSTKANTVYSNVSRIISNGGRNITKEEIEYLILMLVEEHIINKR
ncbi:hypothetical protein PY093_17500 [Cytobacillus sp. S13-E01]|uniref:hypothetical protein n=1 Tax=Cytobacillus sp. S13-E01 TaxID=3031326 RepID=UPI0023D82A57|nr:hypothetical protein [Cytobacillus sp. S13-E01]MDF0728436.1 hypothetical protein [Cytobacillus sp. S13-E01]